MPLVTGQQEKKVEGAPLSPTQGSILNAKGPFIYRQPQGLVCVISHNRKYHSSHLGSWEAWDLSYTGCQTRHKGRFQKHRQVYETESAKISRLQHYPTHFLLRCSFIIGNSFQSQVIWAISEKRRLRTKIFTSPLKPLASGDQFL